MAMEKISWILICLAGFADLICAKVYDDGLEKIELPPCPEGATVLTVGKHEHPQKCVPRGLGVCHKAAAKQGIPTDNICCVHNRIDYFCCLDVPKDECPNYDGITLVIHKGIPKATHHRLFAFRKIVPRFAAHIAGIQRIVPPRFKQHRDPFIRPAINSRRRFHRLFASAKHSRTNQPVQNAPVERSSTRSKPRFFGGAPISFTPFTHPFRNSPTQPQQRFQPPQVQNGFNPQPVHNIVQSQTQTVANPPPQRQFEQLAPVLEEQFNDLPDANSIGDGLPINAKPARVQVTDNRIFGLGPEPGEISRSVSNVQFENPRNFRPAVYSQTYYRGSDGHFRSPATHETFLLREALADERH